MMVYSPTNPEALIGPLPLIAIQVYTTLPLDSDSDHELVTLCQYLASGIDHGPNVSFEIYVTPQPDVFACVEHQRRDILYRKNNLPADGFFPGIAKVAINDQDQLLQGFLLVFTSYSFRAKGRPEYEAESGPLWANFNRSFPLRAKADIRSRIEGLSPHGLEAFLVEGI
jgi:hypothetical protein